MWTVKSESGQLNSVLIQDSVEQLWTKRIPFAGIESSTHYLARGPHPQMNPGHDQWLELGKILRDEGVKVFEVKEILNEIIENSTKKERADIIGKVWKGMPNNPDPDDLTVDNLFWGYPSKPYYNEKFEQVVLPDYRRVAWTYTRDTSFTTPVGTVICNMRRYSRKYEPRIVKICYEYDKVLKEKMNLVYDANESTGVFSEPPCVEGGDTQIIDSETIAIGVGQRSTVTGAKLAAEHLFKTDRDEELKHICVVKLAGEPAIDYMHLDVTINYPDRGKALVMPYVYETELLEDYPPRKLLLKTLEAVRSQSEAHGRPMNPLAHPDVFEELGRTSIYIKGKKNEPELLRNENSFLDFLLKEEKLEKDGIIYVGGRPETDYDVEHLLDTLMEQSRGAPNIVTIKPGLVIGYDRNQITNQELRDHGIKVKEWTSSYLDLLGGPHCSTCPLSREP